MLQRGFRLGKYEIIEPIGSGGMGVVYRARDPFLGREVAIKVLTSVGSPDLLRRFQSEAMAMAPLRHPNILTIFDVGEDHGTPFLVMPLIEGETLRSLIDQSPAASLEAAGACLKQVADALDFAHSQQVVHRDVKPSNIMIEAGTNNAILMDFGVALIQASASRRLTRTGLMLGTMGYMAPEQIVGKGDVGPSSDQYALAVVAFELLTGKLPFQGYSDFEMMNAVFRELPPRLTDFRSDVPESTALAVARALAKDPRHRFSSCEEFVAAAFGTPSPPAMDACHALRGEPFAPVVPPPTVGPRARLGPLRWFAQLFRGRSEATNPPVSPSRTEIDTNARIVHTPVVRATGPPHLPARLPTLPPGLPPRAALNPPRGATVVQPVSLLPGDNAHKSTGVGFPDGGASTRVFRIGNLGSGDGSVGNAGSAWVVEERPKIHLVFKSSPDPLQIGQSVLVHTIPFRIGRVDADLAIPADVAISGSHAEIDWINGAYSVKDLSSSNGTYVNGRRVVVATPVRFGASIRLSNATELTLVSAQSTSVPDLTGVVLDGRYTLVRLLRTTGKAALYEASDLRLPHKLAVKVLSPILASYPGYLEDFRHEAKMAAELQHPHIVRVVDSGVMQLAFPSPFTCNYVCLEMVPGGDLTDRIRERGILPAGETLEILDEVSDALEYAHGRGIVHRGLKPSSILFGHNGFVFVSDFAFAGGAGDTSSRIFVGAPDFLAPEQWDGGVLTAASDQYSLSALTYLMLTGAPPLRGQQDPDIRCANFLRGPLPVHEEAARKGNLDVPTPVSDVLATALSPDPTKRYPSIRKFFTELSRAAGSGTDGPGTRRSVFISYQRDSSAGWAVLFSRELEQKHGISTFVDTERSDGAVRFPARLSRAIKDCDVFVCLLSDKTLNSQWVREEIRLAWESGKPMIPVFQESYEHPQQPELGGHVEALISFEGVHLLDRRNIYVDDAISKVARIVEQSVRPRGTH